MSPIGGGFNRSVQPSGSSNFPLSDPSPKRMGPFVQNKGAAVRPRGVADTVTDLALVKGLNPSVAAALMLRNRSRLLTR